MRTLGFFRPRFCMALGRVFAESQYRLLVVIGDFWPVIAFSTTAYVQGLLMITGNAESGAPPEKR